MAWSHLVNNYAALLDTGITDAATTITVDEELGPRPDLPFMLTLAERDGGREVSWEIMRVVDAVGASLTVQRGQEGTTARSWDAGTTASVRWTAGLAELYTKGRSAECVVVGSNAPDFMRAQADIVCSGVDDHVQLQDAFNNAKDVALFGLFHIGFQSGATSLFIPDGIQITGAGPGLTVLRLQDGTEATMLRVQNVENVRLRDFELDGNRANTLGQQHILRLEDVAEFDFQRLAIHDSRAHAINCVDEVYDGTIRGGRLFSNGSASNGSGVVIGVDPTTACVGIKLRDIFSVGNTLDGLQDKGGRDISYIGNTCRDNERVGLQRSHEATGGVIALNYCIGNGTGLRVEDSAHTQVHDNHFLRSGDHGARFQNNCEDINFHDNEVGENGQSAFAHGLFVFAAAGTTCRRIRAHHNRIYDHQATKTQSRAIRQEGAGSFEGTYYTDNDVRDGGSHANLIEITSGSAVVRDNPGWDEATWGVAESVNFVLSPGEESKGYVRVSKDLHIAGWSVLSGASGSITLDVRRASYANFPTTASLVGAGTKPALDNAQKADGDTSSWDVTDIDAGDVLEVVVDSETDVERVTLELQIER